MIYLLKKLYLTARNMYEWTPLHFALYRPYPEANPKVAQLLIEFGADVNARDSAKYTALHMAAWTGNLKGVEMLLKYGANRNLKTYLNETPMQVAKFWKQDDFEKVVALLKGI